MRQVALDISDRDRAELTKMTASRGTPQGESTRARIVLACADGTVADAARRCGVTVRTASKWKHRFEQCGTLGLTDAPRTGRPATADEFVHQTLTCVLREPPDPGWTTRTIADVIGVSQSTVSRIRRERFTRAAVESRPKLPAQSAILAYVYIDSSRRVLALHRPPTVPDPHRRPRSTTRAIAGAVETVLCAALAMPQAAAHPARPSQGPVPLIELLRRATGDTPSGWSVTVILDVDPDTTATHWLRRNPHVDVVVAPREHWLAQLHPLTEAVDAAQLPELTDLQRGVRGSYACNSATIEWSRRISTFDSNSHEIVTPTGIRAELQLPDSTAVVRGLYHSMTEGTLYAGRKISERALAERVQLSVGVVSDTLRHLAQDGLVHQDDAGRFFVPAPTERDVLETYTARGLLGSAIVRRLASRGAALPEPVDGLANGIVWYASVHDVALTASLDLDLQDELARTADMPRIGAMFLRLTLQLRLFVTLMGLNYQYPVDEIVDDDTRLLDAIRSRDPEAAVSAWRSKMDNCVRYMVAHINDHQRRWQPHRRDTSDDGSGVDNEVAQRF